MHHTFGRINVCVTVILAVPISSKFFCSIHQFEGLPYSLIDELNQAVHLYLCTIFAKSIIFVIFCLTAYGISLAIKYRVHNLNFL